MHLVQKKNPCCIRASVSMAVVAFDMAYQRFKICSRFFVLQSIFISIFWIHYNSIYCYLHIRWFCFARAVVVMQFELQQFLLFIEAETNRDNGLMCLVAIPTQRNIFIFNFILPLSFSDWMKIKCQSIKITNCTARFRIKRMNLYKCVPGLYFFFMLLHSMIVEWSINRLWGWQ